MSSFSVKFLLTLCVLVLLVNSSYQKSLKRTVRDTTSDNMRRAKLLNLLLKPEVHHRRSDKENEIEMLASLLVMH